MFEYPKNGLHHGPSCAKNLCGARNEIYSKKNIKVTFLIEFCSDLDQLFWVGRHMRGGIGWSFLDYLVDAPYPTSYWIPPNSIVVARLFIFSKSKGRPSEWDDSHCFIHDIHHPKWPLVVPRVCSGRWLSRVFFLDPLGGFLNWLVTLTTYRMSLQTLGLCEWIFDTLW